MKTIILEKPGEFRMTDTAGPSAKELGPGEALVRVHRIGICGTDLHAFRGKQPFFTYPRILGHELGVEIVAIGANDRGLAKGDRCCIRPYLNCSKCIACRRGKGNCCVSMNVMGVHSDGGMRELIRVPINHLHKSSKLTLEQLALVETLCIGAHAVSRADLARGEFALVVGAGPIGLAAAQFSLAAGARVIVADVNPTRLAFCQKALGVEFVVDVRNDALAQLNKITQGDLPTAVFDATGNPTSMMACFEMVAHGGKVIYISLVQADITFHDPNFHKREVTLLSSRNALPEDFDRVIQLIEQGKVNTTPWITHRAAMSNMIQVFPSWLEPESQVIKAMVEV